MEKIFGRHSVRAVSLTRPHDIRRMLIMSEKWNPEEEFLALAAKAGIEPEILSMKEFVSAANLSKDDKHQGICVYCKPIPIFGQKQLATLADARLVVMLDQISDPQNLGTILRTSAFFGVDAVMWLKHRSATLSSTVYRVAVGGAEFVRIFRVANLAFSIGKLQELGFRVYGFDERGESTLYETKFEEKAVLVIGAEGQGLRDRTKKSCDTLVSISGGRKGLESLNAGVAASVALGEVFRQRM